MKTTMRSIFLWMRRKLICYLHGRSSFVGMAGNTLPQKFGKGDQLFIQHPSNPHKNIYMFFDTAHLIKNVRNNLLNSRRFVFPQFDYEKDGIEIHCPAGYLAWSDLHQIFEHDVKLQSNLKKAHKLSY